MANFVALIDPDPGRRARFVRQVASLVPPMEGLVTATCASPPFEAVWAAAPGAPVSVTDGDRGAAVVFGTALDADGRPADAKTLRAQWIGSGPHDPEPFDGYYAALAWDPDAGLLAGADVLGRFPVYYCAAGDALLVGSSPELFRHHPGFRADLDPHGLTGILLTNGIVEGRTLWAGVRRLEAGCLLAFRPGQPPRETRQYALPTSDRHHGRPFDEHVDITVAALDDAVRRHVPREPRPLLLLSGGLDSRTIAGFLARQGTSPLAVTRGERDDFEMQCAVRVARRLRFEHRTTETETGLAVPDAVRRATWEQCAAGFSSTGGWSSARTLGPLGTRVITGDSMDWILGGAATSDAKTSFEDLFDFHNRWGVEPAVLDRLLRREVFGDAPREVLASLRRRYEGYPGPAFARDWCFALHHRQRFHISGLLWPVAFGAWPTVPAVDRKLLAVAGGLPLSTLEGRRLQIELLRREFPGLASLPVDRNSYSITPLTPGIGWRVRRRLFRIYRRVVPVRHSGAERRRYFRVMDINGPGWRAIRAAAEPYRHLGREFFHPEVFDALVPPPDARPEYRDPITGPGGMKTLLGFLMWLSRR